eukprot:356500-Chlamydomonas_euryale.AAC.8
MTVAAYITYCGPSACLRTCASCCLTVRLNMVDLPAGGTAMHSDSCSAGAMDARSRRYATSVRCACSSSAHSACSTLTGRTPACAAIAATTATSSVGLNAPMLACLLRTYSHSAAALRRCAGRLVAAAPEGVVSAPPSAAPAASASPCRRPTGAFGCPCISDMPCAHLLPVSPPSRGWRRAAGAAVPADCSASSKRRCRRTRTHTHKKAHAHQKQHSRNCGFHDATADAQRWRGGAVQAIAIRAPGQCRACVRACMGANVRAYVRACVCACVHACVRALHDSHLSQLGVLDRVNLPVHHLSQLNVLDRVNLPVHQHDNNNVQTGAGKRTRSTRINGIPRKGKQAWVKSRKG